MISDDDREAIRRAGDAQQDEIDQWRPLDSTERDLIRRALGVDTDEDAPHRAS